VIAVMAAIRRVYAAEPESSRCGGHERGQVE
jgi:hypothetical protein